MIKDPNVESGLWLNHHSPTPSSWPLKSTIDNSRIGAVYTYIFTCDTKTPIDWGISGFGNDVDILELNIAG